MESYKRATMQLLNKVHSTELWRKIYTYVKVLIEQQGD